jgi:hypothetical protein
LSLFVSVFSNFPALMLFNYPLFTN